jgi:hypothetical protein
MRQMEKKIEFCGLDWTGESGGFGMIDRSLQSPKSTRFPSICPGFGRCGKKLEQKTEIIWAVC